jgi:hypothetical protein
VYLLARQGRRPAVRRRSLRGFLGIPEGYDPANYPALPADAPPGSFWALGQGGLRVITPAAAAPPATDVEAQVRTAYANAGITPAPETVATWTNAITSGPDTLATLVGLLSKAAITPPAPITPVVATPPAIISTSSILDSISTPITLPIIGDVPLWGVAAGALGLFLLLGSGSGGKSARR